MRHATLNACVAVLAVFGLAGSTRAAPPTPDVLALKMLDSEALYTLTGGLKPISEGFWQTRFPADQDTSPEVDAVRAALKELPLGSDLEAGVYVFATPFDGKRPAAAFVAHKPSLRALVERRIDVFQPLGILSAMSPQRVLELIDRAQRSARWRGFGLVFGYPEYAVEFFVAAGEKQAATGKFVERDFVNLPTFVSDRGRFVYAVPKGHIERAEDRYLKSMTAEIFIRYRAWRTVYLDNEKLGAVALLRSWLTPPTVWLRPPEPTVVLLPARPTPRIVRPSRLSSGDAPGPRIRCRLLCR
ncbi:MAG: hypothetical protein FJ261_10010 [Planctomycetes bacterium]|nr:hypothetical protein [Planctomycetota bacterium]